MTFMAETNREEGFFCANGTAGPAAPTAPSVAAKKSRRRSRGNAPELPPGR